MKIPIAKPYLTEAEAQSAYDAVMSHWVTQGPRVEEFEKKFAAYAGSKYAVAVSSCTSALHLSLIVAGINKEDEVICPSLSFIATSNSILAAGARPVFAEINPATLNLDAEKAEKLITKKTKAIILVHQLGMPADIDAFKELCKKHQLILIEDAACAAGSSYKNQKIGSHSDLVCFSFHPRKVITTGDGGMITTNNEEFYTRLKLLRQHGMSLSDLSRHSSDKVLNEEYLEPGYNYRMTDIQAAVGIKQLEKLDWLVEERRKLASEYYEAFKDIDCMKLPAEEKGYYTNYQSYSIYLKDNCPISRDELMQKLLEKGISTRRGVMTIHREPAYKKSVAAVHLPISEKVSDQSIIIPLYVPMTKEEQAYVIQHIKNLILR